MALMPDNDNLLIHLLVWSGSVLLIAVMFMAIREMICWYLRLTPIVALLEKIERHLDNVERETLNRMLPRAERRRPGLMPDAPQLESAAVASAAPRIADQAKV